MSAVGVGGARGHGGIGVSIVALGGGVSWRHRRLAHGEIGESAASASWRA